MLIRTKSIEGQTLHARDGAIGEVDDLYFDDALWQVRYLVVDTGTWLTGRTVLISTAAVQAGAEGRLSVDFTKEQVRRSPDVDTQKPVSRQYEEQLHAHYAWPYYWAGPFVGAGLTTPIAATPMPMVPPAAGGLAEEMRARPEEETAANAGRDGDPHLRSVEEMRGYHVQALDGAIGHVEDLLIDPATWAVRHAIVDTRNWWPGKKVLLSRDRITDINWLESTVSVNVPRDAIKAGPAFTDQRPLTDDYTDELEAHYRAYSERKL